MEKDMKLSKIRFLSPRMIFSMSFLVRLSSLVAQNEAGYLMVVGFSMNKRALRNKRYCVSARELHAPYSSREPLMSHKIGVIGGGLAGLSTAYHLLQKSPDIDITIIDRQSPGIGGASAVAGGLLHPFSPQGKLAYRGMEGLASANELVKAASQFEENVVLRNKIYRVASNEDQAVTFRKTATELPEIATWIEPDYSTRGKDHIDDEWEEQYFGTEKNVFGALRLSGGSKVLHMKSYLKGLWSYCESIGTGTKKWVTCEDIDSIDSYEWKERLAIYDCVVYAAGSGLFQSSLLNENDFPITLVRGQSIEMTISDSQIPWNAILCGKYVSPLPGKGRVIIGATHEFKKEPLTPTEVEVELKNRSYDFASRPWNHGTIDNITSGYRVQSNRGKYGRLPIVGKLSSSLHHNSWIFTGLSGRGILYHGIFGNILTDLILGGKSESNDYLENIDWWRKVPDQQRPRRRRRRNRKGSKERSRRLCAGDGHESKSEKVR